VLGYTCQESDIPVRRSPGRCGRPELPIKVDSYGQV